MAFVIGMANQKGGVAKTTSAFNLGVGLYRQGKKVLLVDADPQGSLTIFMGYEPDSLEKTMYNLLLLDDENIKEVLLSHENKPDLIPANIELSAAELELTSVLERERRLKDTLQNVKKNYDYVIIDSPPSLGLLTINVLVASTGIIVPLKTDYLSMKGVSLLFKTVEKVKKRLNSNLKIMGILPTIYDERTLHNREVLQETIQTCNSNIKVYDPIHKSVRFEETSIEGSSIFEYSPNIKGAAGYASLTKEVMNYVN